MPITPGVLDGARLAVPAKQLFENDDTEGGIGMDRTWGRWDPMLVLRADGGLDRGRIESPGGLH